MTTGTHVAPWWRVPRSHGVVVGGLLLLLGLWGGLAPFIGPYMGYGYTPNTPWMFTWGRLWLQILPAAVTVLAALAVLVSGNRLTGVWASWLAVLAGAWFVVGGPLSRLWNGGTNQAGTPTGGVLMQVVEQIGLFLGLGVVIVFLGTVALTRFAFTTARPRVARTAAEPYPEPAAADRSDRVDTGEGVGDHEARAGRGSTATTTPTTPADDEQRR